MKQPKIKCTRVCKEYGRGPYQIANHWNIAKDHIERLQSIINRLYLDKRVVLPYDVRKAIDEELHNASVGIHNLGQELTKIEGYEYDFTTVEVGSWENPEKSIYANRTKKHKIEDIEA